VNSKVEEWKLDRITTLTSFYFNFKNPELAIYGDKESFELVAVTGHSQGSIYLW